MRKPKRFEVFITTRTSRKRKELDEGTQTAIRRKLSSPYLGKNSQAGLCAMADLLHKHTLQRHAEISALKQQHQEEVTTLKSELGDLKTQQQQQAEDIHGLRSMVKLLLLQSEPNMRPEEVEAMLQNAQNSPVDANSGHGSTHHARNMSMNNLRMFMKIEIAGYYHQDILLAKLTK
ncbi:hypothetical protein PIB30_067583 [Stylosanthes scabra]|uniref:Uncharacterized protein n=1 Tax=Stylosanthes scabra TaxID=79078 RepID=A0ABU6RMU9_9FABA|nr:hypothetical protein [Stylosanthes scabra]